MKILLFGPVYPYRGGIAQFTSLLSLKLSDYQHDVRVISYKRQYPSWLYPGKSDQDPSKEHIDISAEYLLDGINPLSWITTAKHSISLKPDIVILQWWTSFWALANSTIIHYLQTHRLPVIYIIHNALPHEPHFLDSALTKLALSPVINFITLSPREKTRLESLFPNKHVDQVPLPFFSNFALQEFDKNEAKQHLGLTIEVPVILFFGIIRQYKGLEILLKALSILINGGEHIRLVIAGEFWKDKKHYIDIINTNNISKWVTIDDRYIPDELVPLYFSAADAFVAPYIGGSQSAAQRIAMQFGLPIVLTKTIFDEEIIKHQPNYPLYVVKPNNEIELAAAIKQAVTSTPVQSHHDDGWADLINTIERLVK